MEDKNKVSTVIILTTSLIILLLAVAWWLSDSVVIQAELYDSLVDLLYSIIIVSGFLLSRKDRKPKYPEGLIRLEPIVASIVGIVVIGTGSYIIYNSMQRIINASATTSFSILALVILIASTIIKILLFYYVRDKAKDLDSSSLYATAVDLRNDILTHIASIVGFLFVLTQYEFIEPVIAVIIATYILFTGLNVIKENVPNILGFSINDDEKEELKNIALSHKDVHGIHDFEVHFTGDLIDISMHLEVESDMSILEGHEIETTVADKLRESTDYRVNEINIHLDPDELDEWQSAE